MTELTAVPCSQSVFDGEFRSQLTPRFSRGILSKGRDDAAYSFLLLRENRGLGPVVAAAKLDVSYIDVSLRYLEVAHDRMKHGYGRRLFADVFAYAAAQDKKYVVIGGFTLLGRIYLSPLADDLRDAYPTVETIYTPQ